MLADRLMSPLTDPAGINRRLDSVSFFVAEPRLCEALRLGLKRVADMPRALTRLALNRGGPRDLGALRAGFGAAAEIACAVLRRAPAGRTCRGLRGDRARCRRISRGISKPRSPTNCRCSSATAISCARITTRELDEMRALRDESRRVILGLERDLIEETGIRSLKIRHNNVLGYYIEVTANHQAIMNGSDAAKARFIHRQTMASAMRFTTTELAELETKIANAADRALSIELAVFDRLVAEAVAVGRRDPRRRRGARRARRVGRTGLPRGSGELLPAGGRRQPRLRDRGAGVIRSSSRRCGKQAESPFVANDCDLSPEDSAKNGAIWLLTGPNMGGKSTFLRQNALIAILAQMGATCRRDAAHIGVVDRLFSRVGASDDLARGRSTFMVEMVETAAILNQAGERSLVILDEIGRGTATFDGLSIAWAAVEYLHEHNRCRAIFATHFHEMTALAGKLARLHNVTMRVKEWEGDVVFLHEVAKGAADRSYGVQVARLAGLPAAVVSARKGRAGAARNRRDSRQGEPLVDDLPLFSAAVRRETPPPAKTDALGEALAAINPDELTPREALEALYRLKGLGKTN